MVAMSVLMGRMKKRRLVVSKTIMSSLCGVY